MVVGRDQRPCLLAILLLINVASIYNIISNIQGQAGVGFCFDGVGKGGYDFWQWLRGTAIGVGSGTGNFIAGVRIKE